MLKHEDVVCFNSDILINGTPFYWRNCHVHSLLTIHQLYEDIKLKFIGKLMDSFHLTLMQYIEMVDTKD